MRFLGCAVFALAVVCLPWTLRALDVSYGSLFQISHVSRQDGEVKLPLSRGKYANIRVLNRETLDFLTTCPEPCVQDAALGEIKVEEFRAAQTRSGMWIADVSFDGCWQITFLVFKNKSGYRIYPPKDFEFLDNNLRQQLDKLLTEKAAQGAAQHSL